MISVTKQSLQSAQSVINCIYHPSFEDDDAQSLHDEAGTDHDHRHGFMPDDVTRRLAKRMHYAAWRASQSRTTRMANHWQQKYFEARNNIVVGNHKLIYRAVQRWASSRLPGDDLVGECQIVLIRTVAAFNPWLGIRFSTYAFTCLLRALSRLAQRQARDRLAQSLPLGSLRHLEPSRGDPDECDDPRLERLGEFFQDSASLLTAREKFVLSRRFHLNDFEQKADTLEQVGQDLGLSKERVRQVQKVALLKLREALVSAATVS